LQEQEFRVTINIFQLCSCGRQVVGK